MKGHVLRIMSTLDSDWALESGEVLAHLASLVWLAKSQRYIAFVARLRLGCCCRDHFIDHSQRKASKETVLSPRRTLSIVSVKGLEQ